MIFGKSHIRLLAVGLLLTVTAAASPQERLHGAASKPLHRVVTRSPQELQELFRYASDPLPLVSAHRGGALAGLPENCIATFENTLNHTFAILEIDPRFAKDGAVVVHHDASLERTTTGKGLVADHTLQALKQLRLKDINGAATEFQIPTLDEVLIWARGKTIVVLDQKDVPVSVRVKKVEMHKAEAYAMLIVYSFKDAQECFRLNPNIMMEVMVPNREKIAEFDKTGVPWRNVIAFVGHEAPTDPALYKAIHDRGATCVVGTSRNLDRTFLSGRLAEIKRLEPDYRSLLQTGADLIETDIPVSLGQLLYAATPPPPSKARFFIKE
jgi:glycerophosphoryl diester phosphodiesterase